MRILHLTRDYPPKNAGGISTAVGGLVRALQSRNVRSSVISFDAWRPARGSTGQPPPERRGDVLRVSSPAHHDAILAFGKETKPAVLHVHDGLLWEYGQQIAAPKKVFTMHVAHAVLRRLRGADVPTMSESAQARAIAEADTVTVPCAALLKTLPGQGHALAFGIDERDATYTPSRAREGVLFAARWADIKGVHEVFEAMATVCAERDDVGFRFAGGLIANRKAERRWRKRLQQSASPELASATQWLGWLDRGALADEYRRAAILVAPSWHETYGLSVLEAMAHGVAVVASNVDGHAELIEHQRTGWLVPARQAAPLADAILTLLNAPDRARDLGEAAAEEVRDRRMWSQRIDAWLEIYR